MTFLSLWYPVHAHYFKQAPGMRPPLSVMNNWWKMDIVSDVKQANAVKSVIYIQSGWG